MRFRYFGICFVLFLHGICALWAGAACVGGTENQAGLYRAPIELKYQEVVNILFPCEASGEYYLILRFLPSFAPESQIVISRNQLGTYDIDYYFLPAGSKKIAEQIQAMLAQNAPDSPQELASRIRVEHKRIMGAPSAVSELMTSYFALRIPPRLETKVIVDGTRYELWFVAFSAQNVLHLSFEDDNSEGPVRNSVAIWMNRSSEVIKRLNRDHQPLATKDD